MTDPAHKIPFFRLLAFVGPGIPISALGLPLVVHLPNFYATEMGLSLSLVGGIFLAARLWDMITDPVMGWMSDRFPSRWGRRKHWVALAAPILMVGVWFLFLPGQEADGVYLTGFLFLLYIGWTLLTLSHLSWAAELSPDYDERARVQGWREGMIIFGIVLVLAIAALIEQSTGSRADGIAAMGIFVLVVLPITAGLAVTVVPDRPAPPRRKSEWRQALKTLATNPHLRRLLAVDFLSGVTPAVVAALYLFIVEKIFHLGDYANLLLLTYFLTGILGVPLWLALAKRFGKHKTIALTKLWVIVSLLCIYLVPPDNLVIYVLYNMASGLAFGAAGFLMRAIMADVADIDRLESGQERTGTLMALLTMTQKLAFALPIGVIFPLLDWFGFDPKQANTPETLDTLLHIYVLAPMPALVLGLYLIWTFKLTRDVHDDARRQLEGVAP